MKKFTLFILAVCISAMAMAQSKFARYERQSVPARAVKEQMMPSQAFNPVANTKATLEDILGETRYDMQTNASIGPRLTIHSDGTTGGVWTRGIVSGTDRGTGYNYHNGTGWAAAPTARIENERTGWPSYAPLGPTGEIVIAHLNDGLKISTRAVKGSGPWTYSTLMGPTGATDISWPRVITSGPDHMYVHMIASTYTLYQGLDLALLYYRSLDGGVSWDKQHVILPQMTSADYDGFNGDQYTWGTPHGDTIYFAVSGPWVDTFIMQSVDNGETWTKIPILSNANKKLPAGTTYVPPFTMSDGSVAVELDKSGIYHVAFGIGGGYMDTDKYIYINQNGLVYWNSTMPMVKDSLDLDTLEAHGQLVGYVSNGPNPGDTIVALPSYRVGMSSFPQISIDDWNNKYVIWAASTPGNPSPDPYNYRHIWGRAWFHDKTTWGDMIDFNAGVTYMFNEYVYPCMAKQITGDKLAVIYQTSAQPGSNIVSTTIPEHDNNIEYRELPGSLFWPAGTGNEKQVSGNLVFQNRPNPVKDITTIRISLVRSADVSVKVVNITGLTVMELDKGMFVAGTHDVTLDAGTLTPGIYFYSIMIGAEKHTRKMIVE